MTTFEMIPLDTLFFRGAEPMEAGQLNAVSMFPPPVSVWQGALRTAYLFQHHIDPKAYKAGDVPSEVIRNIGTCSGEAPFAVTAILIRQNGELYAPAPYAWFVDVPAGRQLERGTDFAGLKPQMAAPLTSTLALSASAPMLPMVKTKGDATSLGGLWIRWSALNKRPAVLDEADILTASELYSLEHRTGIGIDHKTRTTGDGRLYSASHVRLKDKTSFVIQISADLEIADEGHLQLGGERRLVAYHKKTDLSPSNTDSQSGLFASLSPIRLDSQLIPHCFCTGKVSQIAGWDLAEGFHKPTDNWLPAGSVFTKNMNQQCIAI